MQLIYKAGNITEAQIIKGLLESNGIQAHVGGFYLQGGVGEIAPMDFANIHVQDDDSREAREIIDKYEGAPHQHSSEKQVSRTRQKSSLTTRILVAVAAAGLTGLLFYLTGM